MNEDPMEILRDPMKDTPPPARYDDLQAMFLNCTLKRSPEQSHTDGLLDIVRAIMEKHGVSVDSERPIDLDIATGVYPDMTEHGWPADEWPALHERVQAADIPVIGTPIWLGEKSSVSTQRNTVFMTWNLLHMARMLKDAGGIPAHGNQRSKWEAGARFDHPNPGYR